MRELRDAIENFIGPENCDSRMRLRALGRITCPRWHVTTIVRIACAVHSDFVAVIKLWNSRQREDEIERQHFATTNLVLGHTPTRLVRKTLNILVVDHEY